MCAGAHPNGANPPSPACESSNGDGLEHGTEAAPREPVPLPLPPEAVDKRRAGRFPIEGLDCDLGRVLDLSASGMRIQRRLRLAPDREHFAVLSDGEIALRLSCVIRREIKHGMLSWEYGIEFDGVTPDIRDALCRFVFGARKRRTI